jgi:hypothetical protein
VVLRCWFGTLRIPYKGGDQPPMRTTGRVQGVRQHRQGKARRKKQDASQPQRPSGTLEVRATELHKGVVSSGGGGVAGRSEGRSPRVSGAPRRGGATPVETRR